PTEIVTRSLHDALPILPFLADCLQGTDYCMGQGARLENGQAEEGIVAPLTSDSGADMPAQQGGEVREQVGGRSGLRVLQPALDRSEEHTSSLQSRENLV